MSRIDFTNVREPLENYPWYEVLEQDEYWMDKYGDKHNISEMDTDYIENCIPYAVSACYSIQSQLWGALAMVNGEMAEFYLEMELDRFMDIEEIPLVKRLREELRARK